MQSAIVSRVFRAVLPGRIFIPSGSKALQAPRAVPVHHPVHPTAFYPAETSFYAARGDQQFPVVLPCCSRRGILNRISTCNIHSSTKVSGLQNLLSILCSQKNYSVIETNTTRRSKLVFLSIQAKLVIISHKIH